jgi:hypothetical protein
LFSINWLAVRVTARNTPNRKKDDGGLDSKRGGLRKKTSKAIKESATARRPGPRPPKRLLTMTASTNDEDSAFRGRAIISAAPQAMTATR